MASTSAAPSAPARVCRWYGGKRAALSLRFDDSHPTHVEIAVPLFNQHGLIGTFLVNPGNDSYQRYRAEWEGPVLQHGHELADHTWNHRGAKTDAEADEQIGRTANLLRRLQPGLRQITFEPGGGTLWLQRKPFESFVAKYHLYDANDTLVTPAGHSILSCTEAHSWFSVAQFTKQLEETIASGGWFQPYFHQIQETTPGKGGLPITPEHFRQCIDVAVAHRGEVWQAGMTAIHAYEQERDLAAVWPTVSGDDALTLDLTCGTDPDFYNQPLTLEVDLPAGAAATVTDAEGKAVPSRVEGGVLRFDVVPVDARFTVQAAGLGAAARKQLPEVKAPGAHPYLLFTAADVAALKARNSDPLAKQMWERVIERADRALASNPAEEKRSDHPWARMGEEFSPIEALALGYALTGKREYARAAAPRLVTLAGEDWWFEEKSEMLITAEAISTMALAYDWTYDALTDQERTAIRTAMVEHGLKPIAEASEKGAWWTNWFHCNWGSVIYGQAGVGALALLGEEPAAAEWARLSERKIWHYTHALNEDGSWGESATYAAFAWQNAILFSDAWRRISGHDLFDNPRLRKLPQWFIGILAPGPDDYVPFSNCWSGSRASIEGLLFRLAREYGDGYAQTVALEAAQRHGSDQLAFLWYDPAVEAKPLTELPLDTVFRDLDWAFLRSSRVDPQATLFGLKGGHKEWDHSQHDTNSFVLYAYGRPLLVDLFYPHNIWGVKTEAHNTVMVNGEEQAGRVNVAGGRDSVDHRGTVADLVSAPWYARLVGDASMAYEPTNLTSFVREVMYLRRAAPEAPPDYFVMFDDVELPAPSRVDWQLHTYGTAAFAENRLTVTQNDAAVDVTLVSPEQLSFSEKETNLREIQTPSPFEGVSTVKTLKLTPPDKVSQAHYLSVLAPRAASGPASVAVRPVREGNTLGAEITSGGTKDLALFALDAPEMRGGGVEAVGRSAFVRQSGGRVRGAVLHNGQRLAVGGLLLVETNSAGHALLTFGDDGVEATLDLYDSDRVRIHVDRKPTKATVDGKERAFEYDAAAQCVTLPYWGIREVRLQY